MMIANISATHDREGKVHDHNDVSFPDLSCLLQFGTTIEIHQIYDKEQMKKLKRQSPDEWWNETVANEVEF